MIKVSQYHSGFKYLWNQFVSLNNLPFLFYRDYVEYHKHKFEDSSLLFFKEDELIAILPANLSDDCLYSHQGLTFGGLLLKYQIWEKEVMSQLKDFMLENRIERLRLKPLPTFFNYNINSTLSGTLFRKVLSNQEINLVIPNADKLKIQTRRKRCYKKALKAKLEFRKSEQWAAYWEILKSNLWERHQRVPVHNYQEITCLKKRFPENIQLFTATQNNEIVAGIVVYFYPNQIAHCQYMVTTSKGRKFGGLDFTIFMLKKYLGNQFKISLGVSTLREKNAINEGLYDWKAGFGALPEKHNHIEFCLKERREASIQNQKNFIDVAP